jgi:TM2 domain-containing membrane protein YozV
MWYYAHRGQQYGPISEQQLKDLLAARQLSPYDLVWREGMQDWQTAISVPELAGFVAALGPVPPPLPVMNIESQRIAAGVLGRLFGSLGVHKFYLGMPVQGIILLLATVLTCGIGAMVTHVIGIIEGIIYLSKSDAEFYQTYLVQRRPWF